VNAVVSACKILSATSGLRHHGWWAGDNMVCGDLLGVLRSELIELVEQERFERAGIGRESDFQFDSDIRRDRIYWLNPANVRTTALLDRMEELRLNLNRELFLGLFEFEGHLAHYPPGAFYNATTTASAGQPIGSCRW
jgi:SM-20-related protein